MTRQGEEFVGRRGELLAELFLQDLHPLFVAQATGRDLGVDFFVGFSNGRGGVNLVAVEVKATEQLSRPRFVLPRRQYEVLANSNVPGLIVVADVKKNRCYYAIATPVTIADDRQTVSFPLTEADEIGRKALIERLAP
jgi:hypothetical protein